jgi:CubicO group peptidase (beta-lactamase class C family)
MKYSFAVIATLLLATPAFADDTKIDALFSAWSKPDSPGAVLAVIKDGKVVRRGAYGMADIEREAVNKASTTFHVASVSKQFTAFAIYLLAQDGKLGLDDDIRKHLPEMHDFGHTITIRQLIHHTSGLRDQWNLLAMAGWRLEDVITESDVLRVVSGQKTLNFTPGKEHLYCNTGYTLLGIIVKRVSGKSLPAFTKERMFDPLGMKHTHFHDDYQTLVNGRASSYGKDQDGKWQYVALSYSNVGATSLFTTVDDLALWDQNFYDGKVGGMALLAQMQTRGKLASGREIDYAGGLAIGKYRGLDIVEHSGGDAGYRSNIVRFPKEHLAVVILSNAGDMNAPRLSRKVADAYLGAGAEPLPLASAKPEQKEIKLDPARLDAFVGDFALNPSFVISFTKENGQLMTQATGQAKFPVFPSSERSFFLKVVDAQFTFDAPAADGVVMSATLHQNGRNQSARRVKPTVLSKDELSARVGTFYSEELNVIYKISQKDGGLVLHHPRDDMALTPTSATTFNAPFPIGKLEFSCDTTRSCTSFSVSNGRVRNLVFSKVAITLLAPPAPQVSAFATTPIYLRGSMNGWGVATPLRANGKQFAATVTLERGAHEFKIGSDDFAAIDFGGMPGSPAMSPGETRKLEAVGANLKLNVPARAAYIFMVDVSDPETPSLTVRQ